MLALAAALVQAACGGGESASPSAVARSLTVLLIPVNDAYQAAAILAHGDGSSAEVTPDAQWSTSDASIATVAPNGRVTVHRPGAAEIRATYQSLVATARLSVAPTYTVSGDLRDALDGLRIERADICCWVELRPEGGDARKMNVSDGTYTFQNVPGGNARLIVTPPSGYEGQTRDIAISSDTTVDVALVPLPVKVWGDVWDPRTEARPPKCQPTVEVVSGVGAGRSTSANRTRFEFSGTFAPGTAVFRASAPGGYTPRERTVRVRANRSNNEMQVGFNLECPGCPRWEAITCP